MNKTITCGCMGLGGGWEQITSSLENEKIAQTLIEVAIESGIKTFDHADIYALGKAEEVFGSVLKKNKTLRDDIILQSKAGIRLRQSINGSSYYDSSKKYLVSQIETSLKRLHTEYLDAFFVHRPDPLTSMEKLAETLTFIKEKQYARKIGVSNMTAYQIASLQKYVSFPIFANQVQFSLGHRLLLHEGVFSNRKNEYEGASVREMREYAYENKLEIQAWSPLDKGMYMQETGTLDEAVNDTRKHVTILAEKYQTSKEAILLVWVLALPCNMSVVIGTTTPERIKKSAKALSVKLEKKDWYTLWVSAQGRKLP